MITILNRYTDAVLHTSELPTVREAVLEAIAKKIDLSGADLTDADLTGADLSGANLSGAYLSGAYLSGAYLRSANLTGADLRSADLRSANLRSADLRSANLTDANLTGADLTDADLSGANLRSADLTGADLSGANLSGADLTGADLTGADLSAIREDLCKVLASAPKEVPALLLALQEGRIDGSTYSGTCACLVGTIANARQCTINEIAGLAPDSNRPAERWFLAIAPGGTPQNNQVAAITAGWIADWLTKQAEIPPVVVGDETAPVA